MSSLLAGDIRVRVPENYTVFNSEHHQLNSRCYEEHQIILPQLAFKLVTLTFLI
jgi:hypothetical protein